MAFFFYLEYNLRRDKIEEIIDARTSMQLLWRYVSMLQFLPIKTFWTKQEYTSKQIHWNPTKTLKKLMTYCLIQKPLVEEEAINLVLPILNSLQELNELLDQAVSHEDYEKAAKIRDEISKDNFSIAFHYDFL
jgi:hypothetical protein